jgi:hypothetical protein
MMTIHLSAYEASKILDALKVAMNANPDDERGRAWDCLYDKFGRILDQDSLGLNPPSSLDLP